MKKLGTLKDFSAMFVRTGDYDLYQIEYHYGGIAVVATDTETGEPVFTASVFIEGQVPTDPDTFWLKSWIENEGILEELEGHNVLERTGNVTQAGFATAYEVELKDAKEWYKG